MVSIQFSFHLILNIWFTGMLNFYSGRKQADYCGKRLKEADFAYTRLVSSTMTRAVETAEIIHKHLPHLTWEKEPNLCEGAPIPPEPPVGNWKPEQWVCSDVYSFFYLEPSYSYNSSSLLGTLTWPFFLFLAVFSGWT